jgi:biotin operon repressor
MQETPNDGEVKMAETKIDIRDLRDGKFLWLDKSALKLISAKAGNRGVTVYSWLCYYANARDQNCFPSMNTLARQCGVSGRTIARTIKRLEQIGAIAIVHENGKCNIYRLLDVPGKEETPDTRVRRPRTPLSGVPMTPLSTEQELIEQELLNKTVACLFPVERQPSSEELKALTALFLELKSRINLVSFMKTLRKKQGCMPPPVVMIKVCMQFKAQGALVRAVWPWFQRVVKAETGSFNAAVHVREHERIKKEPIRIGDILAGIAKHAS